MSEFTEEEKERNKRKLPQFHVREGHPIIEQIEEIVKPHSASIVKVELDPNRSVGINGCLCLSENAHPDTFPAPFNLGADIQNNKVTMASFLNPPHQTHACALMEGANEEVNPKKSSLRKFVLKVFGLTRSDIPPEAELWYEHPRASNDPPRFHYEPRPQFSIDKNAAHRFVVHGLSQPRFREDAPNRSQRPFKLRASAPEFVPPHVTQMALQMTGGYPNIRPPPLPPSEVTDAAIRLNERVRQGHRMNEQGFPALPPFGFQGAPQNIPMMFPMANQQPRFPQTIGLGLQPQIRGNVLMHRRPVQPFRFSQHHERPHERPDRLREQQDHSFTPEDPSKDPRKRKTRFN